MVTTRRRQTRTLHLDTLLWYDVLNMKQAKITRNPNGYYQVVWSDGRAWHLFASPAGCEVTPTQDFRIADAITVTTFDEKQAVALCEKFHEGTDCADLKDWIRENNALQTVYTSGQALDEIQAIVDKLSTQEARILLRTALDLIGVI